ncbi:MAG: hypothetical protein ACP5QZ_02795 [Candidatus Sumerlaeaceae bacterium]
MARLDTRVLKEAPRPHVSWKVLFLLFVIGSIWAYIGYKYVQYRVPSRTRAAATNRTNPVQRPTQPRSVRSASQRPPAFLQLVKELNLTDEQKQKIELIAKETTEPRTLRFRVNRVLTPQQREQLTSRAKELAAKRAEEQRARVEKQKANAQKLKKYYGDEADYAARASKAIREQSRMRRQAAQTTTSTKTAP